MAFWIVLLLVIVLALWIRGSNLKSRVDELEHKLTREREGNSLLASLTVRVHTLEQSLQPQTKAEPAAAPPPKPAPPPAPEPKPEPPVWRPQLPVTPVAARPPEPEPAPASPPPPPPPSAPPFIAPEPVPAFSLADRLREKFSGEEWEAIVGGSILNKLGALVLVIGLALLLSYTATHMGPVGRVALALAVSFSLIAGGVVFERKQKYLIFARGLLGGGWAALYLTAYSMHALEAARVIENPLAGAILLTAVAAGMILHSLRYNSQAVSGLAYFAAFAALAVTPVATFSVIALVPLGASLLYIAYRFEWFGMALFGLVATYGTAAYKATGTATVLESQSIVGTYWLLFEAFDLLRAAKRKPARGATAWIAPLNALAALGLSYMKWSSTPTAHLWQFFAGAAAVYLISALLRARLRPPATIEATDIAERTLSGYEGPVSLAAALAIPAMFLGLSGFQISLALLAEAELLFLAGLFLRQNYLRHLAIGAFLTSLVKLAFIDIVAGDHTLIAGRQIFAWTPTALLTAAIFYANRALKRPGLEYSYAAAAILATILGFEVDPVWIGTAWLALALVLFEFGFWTGIPEFRYQGYILGALGGTVRGIALAYLPPAQPWLRLGTAALGAWIVTGQAMFIHRLPDREASAVRDVCDAAGNFFFAVLLWRVVPRDFLGVAWLALGVICFEIGLLTRVRWFRTEGDIIGGLGIATLASINVLSLDGVPVHQAAPLGAAAGLGYLVAVHTFRLAGGGRKAGMNPASAGLEACATLPEHCIRRDLAVSAATVFLAALCWYALPNPLIAVSWGVIALALLELGIALPFPVARANGHVLIACGIARLFAANFTISGSSLGISHRLLTVLPFSVLCYYIYDLTNQAQDRLARAYLYAGAILVVFLLRFELGRTMTVIGWSIFCLALLYAGLRLDKPDLRWQSYAVAAWTFVRCWTTNFYIPESLFGMRARVLTGAIVIASFYCAELLSPRTGQDRIKPRVIFSCLATALLTALLCYEVSGRLLTVALGIEGVALLAVGFPLRERALRLAGLGLFLFCVLKLFIYDLRELETLFRILSFIVLGLLLLGASWAYTRFREQLRQYL